VVCFDDHAGLCVLPTLRGGQRFRFVAEPHAFGKWSKASLYGLVDRIADIFHMPDIRMDELRFRAEAADLLGQGTSRLVTTAGHDDPGAFLSKASAVARPIPIQASVIRTTGAVMDVLLRKRANCWKELPKAPVPRPAQLALL
jgi:hypothetical protein